jgi:hypothetical protein
VFAVAGASGCARAGPETLRAAIDRTLVAKCRSGWWPLRDPDTALRAVYEPGRSPLVVFSNPILKEALPSTRFYTATLSTDEYEMPTFDVLVSATPVGTGFDVRTYAGPGSAEASPGFLQQFEGVRAGLGDQHVDLARAIAGLIASITPLPTLRDLRLRSSRVSIQLDQKDFWTHEISVVFTPDGRIGQVFVTNPSHERRLAHDRQALSGRRHR